MKSSIGLYYQLTVTDNKTGKIISQTPFRRSKSFVLQFLQILEVQGYPSVGVSIKDTSNTPRAVDKHENAFKLEAAVGDVTIGTVVGTGTTSPTNSDYALETLIAHGVGAGELSYGAQSKTTTAVVAPNVDFILTRTFNNGSGGTINVTEAGIYCIAYAAWYFMILHDVFAAVEVANGQTLTVTYTFRTTV